MASRNKALGQLKIISDKAQESKTTRVFLLNLIDFCKTTEENPELKVILQSIQEAYENDAKKFLALEKQCLNELDTQYVELKTYLGKHKITQIDITEFEGYNNEDPKKRISSTWHPIDSKRQLLIDYLHQLVMIDPLHIKFVTRFAHIKGPLPSPIYSEFFDMQLKSVVYGFWLQEKESNENKQINSVWYYYNMLAWIKNSHDDHDNIIKKILNEGDIFGAMQAVELRKKVERHLFEANQDIQTNDFPIDLLNHAMQKVCNYIDEKLQDPTSPTKKYANKIIFEDHNREVIVKYGLRAVAFSKDDEVGRYVAAFAKNPQAPKSDRDLMAKIKQRAAEALDGKEINELKERRKSANTRLKQIGLHVPIKQTKINKNQEPNKKIYHWVDPKYI